jgi:hypothetical protein
MVRDNPKVVALMPWRSIASRQQRASFRHTAADFFN